MSSAHRHCVMASKIASGCKIIKKEKGRMYFVTQQTHEKEET